MNEVTLVQFTTLIGNAFYHPGELLDLKSLNEYQRNHHGQLEQRLTSPGTNEN